MYIPSNRSKSEATDGAAGGGAAVYKNGCIKNQRAFSLGFNAEVFNAKAAAAL